MVRAAVLFCSAGVAAGLGFVARPAQTRAVARRTVTSATVVEEETDSFEALPDLLDDPFDQSGDEDLLASFDLDSADVGNVLEWPELTKFVVAAQRAQDREKFGRQPGDCGSPEVQIAMFTTRIKFITAHVIANPKDHASRRGLLALVSKRRRLLHYFYTTSPDKAAKLIDDLGVRFRFRNQMPVRADKYRQYKIKENKKKK
ncbi:hypothetical protein M885DRAFT_505266 [Pelagophyceae sp. CCMP2097]|nr:hypothetical protein M885DRAFT_505266 [Pelagophyceae sp. CCMP2097]